MAGLLEIGQDGTLGEAINRTEDAWHDRPRGLPGQFGTHPEASGAGVWKGQDAEGFGGDSYEPFCGSCV